jgi:hypothetical protein
MEVEAEEAAAARRERAATAAPRRRRKAMKRKVCRDLGVLRTSPAKGGGGGGEKRVLYRGWVLLRFGEKQVSTTGLVLGPSERGPFV